MTEVAGVVASDAVAVASTVAAAAVPRCFASAARHWPISSWQNPDSLKYHHH